MCVCVGVQCSLRQKQGWGRDTEGRLSARVPPLSLGPTAVRPSVSPLKVLAPVRLEKNDDEPTSPFSPGLSPELSVQRSRVESGCTPTLALPRHRRRHHSHQSGAPSPSSVDLPRLDPSRKFPGDTRSGSKDDPRSAPARDPAETKIGKTFVLFFCRTGQRVFVVACCWCQSRR